MIQCSPIQESNESKFSSHSAIKLSIVDLERIDHIEKEKKFIANLTADSIRACEQFMKLESHYESLEHQFENVIQKVMNSDEFISNTEQITDYQAEQIYLCGLNFNDIPPYAPENYSTDNLINRELMIAFKQKLDPYVNELFTPYYIKKTAQYGAEGAS